MILPDSLKLVFANIESSSVIDEHGVAQLLGEFHQKHGTLADEAEAAIFAERYAFTLAADRSGESGPWGCYFRPLLLRYDSDGAVTTHAIEALSPKIVAYWTARAAETHHPVLRARYADAAWELAPAVAEAVRDVRNATTAIDAYIITTSSSTTVIPVIERLRRALNLALAIHDADRTNRVVDEMIALAKRAVDPRKIGASVAIFDTLFELRRKLKLSAANLKCLVDQLEECLASTAAPNVGSHVDHYAAQQYGERLLRFYRSAGEQSEVVRISQAMAGAAEKAADTVPAMMAAVCLQEAHVIYLRAGLVDDAQRVLIRLKAKGRESAEQMIEQVVTQTIPVDEVDDFLKHITDGGFEACFGKIVTFFLPKSQSLRERLAKQKEDFPLLSMIPITLHDNDQMIASVGNLENDEEGRLIYETAQDLQFWTIFLMHSLELMIAKYELSPEDFLGALVRSYLWGPERYQLMKNGLRHYWEGDYIAAIHVLVPQIEHGFRVLLSVLGRPTNILNEKLGAYQEIDLGGILTDQAMAKLLGDDIHRYVRSVLVDRRGWNLRNKVCHGLFGSHFYQRQLADRVIHILMLVSCFRLSRGRNPNQE